MKKRYAYFVNDLGLGDQIFYVHLFVNSIVNNEKCILISNKIDPFIQSLYPDNHQIISENHNRVAYEPLDINELHLNFKFNNNEYIFPNKDKVVIGCAWKSFNSQYGHKKVITIVLAY